ASAGAYYERFADNGKADLLYSPEKSKEASSYDYIVIDAKLETYLFEKEVRPRMLDLKYCLAYEEDLLFVFKKQTGTQEAAKQCKRKDTLVFQSRFLSFDAVNLPFSVGKDTRLNHYSPQIVRAAFAKITPPGHMLYGPYIHLPPGQYQARFLIKFEYGSREGAIRLDVAARQGSVILGRLLAQAGEYHNNGQWQWIEFPFTIEEGNMDDVELRVYHDGNVNVSVRHVSIGMSEDSYLGMHR
ncbi:MAG: hypothetical protein OEZ04_10075, partial [Nitrospinota bacterium]|nr:hypothetical protein [Nitrospinota bacterium]